MHASSLSDLPEGEPHTFVTCRLCGRHFRCVEHSHLVARHGIGIEEYERRFPDSPRVCTETLLALGRVDEARRQLERHPG